MICSCRISLILFMLWQCLHADHFRGGIITWRPLNPKSNASTVQIQLHQRYFWNREWSGYSIRCTESNVVSKTQIPVSNYITCRVTCGSSTFPVGGVSTIMTSTDCDTNPLIKSWSGERYEILTLPATTDITIGYRSNAWFGPNLYPAAGLYWMLANRMNLARRPDGLINSSPVTNTLPVLFKPVGQPVVHVVQMADNDGTDILKCRWSNDNSSANINQIDECEGACMGLHGISTLYEENCTLAFTLPLSRVNWYYAVALQIEDYYDSSSTVPMSSVPIQFLFYAYTPSGSCTTRPAIIGERPNRACIGTPINKTLVEKVIAEVYCNGTTIVNFVTSSPIGMQHSSIVSQGNNIYVMTLTWTPEDNQAGPQGFCAAAVDNNNLQSDGWCITYLVDYESPDLVRTKTIQGTASPIGTIFSNHSIFSIQATRQVNRPTRNGTYVKFVDATNNSTVQIFDAGWQPNLLYTGNTIVIMTNYTWKPGRTYYVLFDSGVASGTEFCGPESAPITDPTFWSFNIWDPGLSSTTSTTTTPPTTPTVTTRPISTTTPNTMLTTTGIIMTSATTVTTSTSTSPTTSTTTTDTSTTQTVTVTNMPVVDAKTLEDTCKPPIATMTAVSSVVGMILHSAGIFYIFTQFNKHFNPNHIRSRLREEQHFKRLR